MEAAESRMLEWTVVISGHVASHLMVFDADIRARITLWEF
jgi:hypothetical protein